MKFRDLLDFLILSALWGGSYLFMRLSTGSVNPFAMAELRMVIATIFIGLMLLLKPSWRPYLHLPRSQWHKLLFIAFFNSALPFLMIAYAIQFINAGTGAILNTTAPLWGAVIASLFFRDHLSKSRTIGLAIGFLGVIYLMWGRASFGGDGLALPIIAAMVGTISYGIAANYLKQYCQGWHPLMITFWSLLISSLILFVPTIFNWPQNPIPGIAWLGIVGLGIFSTAIAYLLFFRLAERTSPSTAMTVTFLVPLFSMLWGEIFLGEEVTTRMIIGAVIVLIGTALAIGLVSFSKPRSIGELPMD